MLTVQKVYEWLDSQAPFDTQESFDNSGLLLGRRDAEVHRILVTLDVTLNAAMEAAKIGAQLIISHHPLMFHARKRFVEEDPESKILCFLIRHNIALISAHTNLDLTDYSGSACAARALELENIRSEGLFFLGELPRQKNARELAADISRALDAPARLYGREDAVIRTLAIVGGSYDEGYPQAKALGAQALLTGEVRHHNALAASMEDFVLLDGTHYGTEALFVPYFSRALQNAMNVLQYNLKVYPSQAPLFGLEAEKGGS